ncbi:MAG: LPXTG cell wall anchor domain-containing protein [Oscillospiraceae bacterium]|nr:LPXTG cell wall anchor domain-containing protein [Oscillospiraceae bacterium]
MLFLNNSPATGNTNMIIWIIVGLAAAALLAFYFIRRRKK